MTPQLQNERMRIAAQERLKEMADAVKEGEIPSSPEAYGKAELN